MQCPTCSRELADQAPCEICNRLDEAPDETTGISGSRSEEGFADYSNTPPAADAPPQTTDSFEVVTAQPAEPEFAEVPEPPRQETESREPAIETASSISVDSKGEQSILEKAFQTIGDIYQTEIGDDDRAVKDIYKTEIGGDVRPGRDVHIGDRYYATLPLSAKTGEVVSLYSLTQELPRRTLELHQSVQSEVRGKVSQLKATRLMFITCPYAEFAVDAGHVAVGELGLGDPTQRRLLYYEDVAEKDLAFTVRNLLEQIPQELSERAILVYAQRDSAQSFLDSIFDTPNRIDIVRAELQRGGLFLIVIVAPQDAQKRLGALKRASPFAYVEIPFLRPFLRQNYPDDHERLEEEIVAQRARGKWEQDETSFCQQILDLYETEQLQAVVEAGGPDDPKISAESLLKESGLVEKSVLYAAAFFQEITVTEFRLVVESLLGIRTIDAASPANGVNDGRVMEHTQVEAPLTRIWDEKKDQLFNEWLREAFGAKDSVRVVNLSNSALREPLQKLFEKRHRFYLMDQFKALQERGIFFHPSIRLAENTTKIAVRLADTYPDKFNDTWIVELVNRLSRHFDADLPETHDGEDGMFQFLRSLPPGTASSTALSRVSAVLRRMLQSPQLKGVVQSSLERLIKGGYHQEALLLTKHLQFTTGFDELYWIKQLLHRADNRTRHLTYYYLYAYLKRADSGVYEILKRVEAWLPQAERATASYSQFDHFALRLLVQYCVESVARFNSNYYGDWPSRYPLFAVKDGAEADDNISLIAKWLLHPGIETTLVKLKIGGTRMTLIGALLAEWAFILLGPGCASATGNLCAPDQYDTQPTYASAEAAQDDELSPVMLFDLLVRQFASRTNLSQRLELLKYWNKLNHDLLKYQLKLPTADGLRQQLSWKRELVSKLLTRFKKMPSSGKALPTAR